METGLRLMTAGAQRSAYCNAQIDDYGSLPRRCLPWRPPLRMQVRARFPTPIRGTAGFGFWNSPITPLGSPPALPAAIWFFYASPPSEIAPALGIAGSGWKASCLDLTTRAALAWAPAAPAVLLLGRFPTLQRRIWTRVQPALRIAEASLGSPDPNWRTYSLEWQRHSARFLIDDTIVLETDQSPAGPLGFVAWIDTQWLIATPQGRFGWGLLDVPEPQYFEIESITVRGPD